jgi:lysophospholipase L1-like esterase
VTGHPGSRTTSFIQTGDEVSAATLNGTMTDHWYFISGIDVMAPETTKAVAILGDSITDGRGTTTNGQNRWPDRLAENLQAGAATKNVSVLNLGIGGNTILQGGLGPTALARLQSQIIDQPGVAWVMVLEGVNDIGGDASGAEVVAGLESIVQDVRAAGLTVYGIPILPFAGSSYDSPAHQQARTEVNDWIAMDGSFDAVIAMDEAVSDGGSPPGLKIEFDDGDRLHLNPAGYKAMADAVDLALLQ